MTPHRARTVSLVSRTLLDWDVAVDGLVRVKILGKHLLEEFTAGTQVFGSQELLHISTALIIGKKSKKKIAVEREN